MLVAGAGVAGATNSWDSFAGGLAGGITGGFVGNGIVKSQQFQNWKAGNRLSKINKTQDVIPQNTKSDNPMAAIDEGQAKGGLEGRIKAAQEVTQEASQPLSQVNNHPETSVSKIDTQEIANVKALDVKAGEPRPGSKEWFHSDKGEKVKHIMDSLNEASKFKASDWHPPDDKNFVPNCLEDIIYFQGVFRGWWLGR